MPVVNGQVVLNQSQVVPGAGGTAPLGASVDGGTHVSQAQGAYYTPNSTGGLNYFNKSGQPITNTQYGAYTGQDYGALERQALAAYNAPKSPSQLSSTNTGPAAPSAAQTDPLLASLGQLDTILGNKNTQSTQEHDRAVAGYDAQDALDHAAIDQNTHQNEQALTSGNQAALLNAANGSSGLRGVLSSLGALGGSGLEVIKHLVGLAANSDTGSARQTFNTNATSIGQSAAQTSQLEKQRRDDAEATLQNNIQNNQSNVLTSKQSIYQQLANLFGAGTSQGNDYASQATALAAPIAATTRASVAPYAAASSLFSPAALQTYLAGTQNLNASATGPASDTPINSPLYAPTTKKEQVAGVA